MHVTFWILFWLVYDSRAGEPAVPEATEPSEPAEPAATEPSEPASPATPPPSTNGGKLHKHLVSYYLN